MPIYYGENPLPDGCRWRRPSIPDREAERQLELEEAVTDLAPPERRVRRLLARKATLAQQRAAGRGSPYPPSLDPADPGRLRSR